MKGMTKKELIRAINYCDNKDISILVRRSDERGGTKNLCEYKRNWDSKILLSLKKKRLQTIYDFLLK